MALKKLNRFTYFDMEGFLAGKRLLVTGISEWKDYDTKATWLKGGGRDCCG